MPGMAHVIEYKTEFDISKNYNSGVFEVVTGYMPTEFSDFYTFEPQTHTLTPLSDGPGEQNLPIIFSTTDSNYAMGIYSPYLPQHNWTNVGYGRFRFPSCTKWNCVFRESPVPAGIYKYRSYVIVGSLENVEVSMIQLFNYFIIHANFTTDTVCVGTPTTFTDLTTGAHTETIYQWDIYNNGTIDTTIQGGFTYTFPSPGTYEVKLKTINGVATEHQDSIIKTVVVMDIPQTPLISLQNGNILHSNVTSGNQWYNQNGPINGATGQDYTVTENGNYYDIVSNGVCSSDTSNIINVDLTTELEIINNNNEKIKVYPNPVTSDNFIIERPQNNKKVKFDIINSKGQVIYHNAILKKTQINIPDMKSGIYIIKFDDGIMLKIVKKN